MLQSIINQDWSSFNALLTVLAILYACVFVSVLVDLFFGVKRAKRLKIVRTSLTSSSSFAPYQSPNKFVLWFRLVVSSATVAQSLN
jgi:hypothetical protein